MSRRNGAGDFDLADEVSRSVHSHKSPRTVAEFDYENDRRDEMLMRRREREAKRKQANK